LGASIDSELLLSETKNMAISFCIRDPARADESGLRAAALSYAPAGNDRGMMNFMLDRVEDIAAPAGAFEFKLNEYGDPAGVYRTPAWYMIGTCRMGASTEMSVVNKWQQSWDVPNLFIVHGTVLTTGGMVNPTPAISALPLHPSTYIRDSFRDLSRTTRAAA
jgi:2-methyl-1,2-propanediol dehydrogenase